jgi:hypothetical protein
VPLVSAMCLCIFGKEKKKTLLSIEPLSAAATTHRYQNLSVAILAEEARRLSPIPPLPLGHPNW